MNDHIPAEDFAAYVDGMLSVEKKSALENHFSRCPACLDELVEIVDIRRDRHKIPAGFLKRALGEKSKTPKSVLHLRLVFEMAAAFVVVVFIGYLFFSGNRFWQTPEGQKPSVMIDKNARLGDTSTAVHEREIALLPAKQAERADAKKANNERTKADADQRLADSLASEKRANTVAGKGLPAASSKAVPAFAQENKLEESPAEQSRLAAENESSEKNELARTATIPETVGALPMDFAAKGKLAAKGEEEAGAEAEHDRKKQKKPEPTALQPLAAKAKKGELKDEKFRLRSSVAISETAAADQPAFPPIRIEGDAVWTDLRNPELIFAWSWFQKGLVLELQIDGAGTVIAVVPLGKIDPLLAKQAENEAKKLLFSVSKNKSRRARLVAKDMPTN